MQHSVDFASALRQDVALSSESLSSMLERERTHYSCRDYLCHGLHNQGDERCLNEIAPADRTKIVDWCYDIVDQFHFDRETVAIAMNLADRFASTKAPSPGEDILQDRTQYQLVAVTSLYISIKFHERATFSSHDFTAACHGTYTVEEIEGMEINILNGLEWRLCPPTSLQIAYRILTLLVSRLDGEGATLEQGTWNFLQDEVAFGTESAVRDYRLAIRRPSTTAVASIINAVEVVSDRDYERLTAALLATLKEFDFDSSRALLQARDRLHRLVHEEGGDDAMSEATRIPSPGPLSLESSDADGSCLTVY